MTGPVSTSVEHMPDLSIRERFVMAPVIALIVALGFFPNLALDVINPAVTATLDHVGVTDPEPAVPQTISEESE
jgi:NADH-quinone oxidoreductase subunit M